MCWNFFVCVFNVLQYITSLCGEHLKNVYLGNYGKCIKINCVPNSKLSMLEDSTI